ncbi:MAG: CatB-related O-acetyltransferase [Cetobacterium sp.]
MLLKIFKYIYFKIFNKIKYYNFILLWKKKNRHNKTIPLNYFPLKLVTVGKLSYGNLNVKYWGTENEGLKIGNYVSIGPNVQFILGGNHEIETMTTYPFKVKVFGQKTEAWSKGPIIIKDDVWIGMNTLILSGVTIGQGAIIGAGSVIVKDVEPYSVYGGNPGRLLKYRYNDKEIREQMEKLSWNKIEIKNIQKNLYKKLDKVILKEIFKEIKENDI